MFPSEYPFLSKNCPPLPKGETALEWDTGLCTLPAPLPENAALSLCFAPEEWHSAEIRHKWDELLQTSSNLNALFQSRQWLAHVYETDPDKRLSLAVLRNQADQLVGIVPLVIDRFMLDYHIRAHSICKTAIRTIFVLGSEPLLAEDANLHDRLFAAISDNFLDCQAIGMTSVPTESFLWRYLQFSQIIRNEFILFLPVGIRKYHSLSLPTTFEEYLSKFKSKKKYNLQRQIKLLRERGQDRLQLERVDSKEQVEHFLNAAVAVAQQSWQHGRIGVQIDNSVVQRQRLEDLAERGLLRSYLLRCGDIPCAFVVGYQFNDVYHYVKVGYDQSFAEYSPGTALLYLLIEDLIQNSSAKRLNFDFGDAGYKREFGNIHSEDASVLLLRKTFRNSVRRISYSAFRTAVDIGKKCLPRRKRE